jgi:uncharacterized coiled-coil protein SlyX
LGIYEVRGFKMAEAQKGRGSKGALIGMAVVIVVLVLSNVYTYMSFQNQIASLNSQITEKDNTIASLNSQITSFRDQITGLIAQISSLNSQIEDLKKPQLHNVNFEWSTYEPWVGQHYIHVTGTVFNSGTYTASNVKIEVKIYNSNMVLIKSGTINLGSIPGKEYTNFDTTIEYDGHCASYAYAVTYG